MWLILFIVACVIINALFGKPQQGKKSTDAERHTAPEHSQRSPSSVDITRRLSPPPTTLSTSGKVTELVVPPKPQQVLFDSVPAPAEKAISTQPVQVRPAAGTFETTSSQRSLASIFEQMARDVNTVPQTRSASTAGKQAAPDTDIERLRHALLHAHRNGEFYIDSDRLKKAQRLAGLTDVNFAIETTSSADIDRTRLSLRSKERQVRSLPFRHLYHMTHLDNIVAILQSGLLSHQAVRAYTDISDREINNSRLEKADPVYNTSLHHYVPFYFNVRNAMLYRVQKNHQQKIAILEVNKLACLLPKTLFSFGNAAAHAALFTNNIRQLEQWSWPEIFQSDWQESKQAKQKMMSETLIADRVDATFIQRIHFPTPAIKAEFIMRHLNAQGATLPAHIQLCITPELFFTLH